MAFGGSENRSFPIEITKKLSKPRKICKFRASQQQLDAMERDGFCDPHEAMMMKARIHKGISRCKMSDETSLVLLGWDTFRGFGPESHSFAVCIWGCTQPTILVVQDTLSFETTTTATVSVAVDFNLSNAGKQRENTINNINTAYGPAVENQMIAGEAKLITINYRLRSSRSGNDGGKYCMDPKNNGLNKELPFKHANFGRTL